MNKEIRNFLPFATLMLVSIMFSCTHNLKKDRAVIVPTTPEVAVKPVVTSSPSTIDLTAPQNVILKTVEGSLPWQVAITAKAMKRMNEVVQSKCFYDFIANRKLIQTNGKTPVEVAKHLQSLMGTIPVKFYYTPMRNVYHPLGTSAVAYRMPPSFQININTAYFGEQSNMCEISGTYAHESIAHTLGGYDHDFNPSPSREFSVPYSVNAAFSACCH